VFLQRQGSESAVDEPVEYVSHLAIRATSWVIRWTVFAASTGLVWDFVVCGSFRVDRVVARALVVLLALAMLTIAALLIDLFGGFAQHAWDKYSWSDAKRIVGVVAIAFLLTTTPYVWFVIWVLKRTWQHVLRFSVVRFAETAASSASSSGHADVRTWIVLVVINAALFAFALFSVFRNPYYPYNHTVRDLGLRKCIAGMCLMAWLRTLVPRRDFFLQAPVVSWMPVLAVLVCVHANIPIRLFAITIPVLLLVIAMPYALGWLAPPLWMFLGTNELDSFRLFYDLRATWRRHGLTLLDRNSSGGQKFYTAFRSISSGSGAFYDPDIGRIWSLRTRPGVWQTAVRLLAVFVPVIVVDWRQQPSDIVRFEVDWLKRRNLLGKVYMVVSSDNPHAMQDSLTGASFIEEEALLASPWMELIQRSD
jgi:hypothetical protein